MTTNRQFGGAGVGTVSFGAAPGSDLATLVITGQTRILSTSVISVGLQVAPSIDHSADEHIIEDMIVRAGAIIPGVGFTIYVQAGNFPLHGSWNVQWSWR